MARLSFFGWPEMGRFQTVTPAGARSARGHPRPQSFDHEPGAGRQFEEPEAGIEPPQVYELGEVRRDDKGKSTHRSPRGDDNAESGKSSWDVTRFEEQVAASG